MRKIKVELIDKFIKQNNISKSKFCKLCKISPETLKKIYERDNARLLTLTKISIITKVPINKFIDF